MSNVVFILGAGASVDCGAPVMGDFLDTAKDLLAASNVGNKGASFRSVFKAIAGLQAVHSKAQFDLNNIESIFTALELGRVIRTVPGLREDEIEDSINALKDVIAFTLEAKIIFPVSGGAVRAPSSYTAFSKLLAQIRSGGQNSRSVSVITFNYDVALDVAMAIEGFGPNYCLEDRDPVSGEIPLLKLHGSLSWAESVSDGKIVPTDICDLINSMQFIGNPPSKTHLRLSEQLEARFRRSSVSVRPEPVIVPPSWNKADYHGALSSVWAAAAKHLSEAEHIFIMGYSLPETDAFFKHLYALGAVGNVPLRSITIFNPDKTSVDQRFRGLLGPGALSRYKYETRFFIDAINDVRTALANRRFM